MNKSLQPDNLSCCLPENNKSRSNDVTKVICPKLALHPLHCATINDKYNMPLFKSTHCSNFKKECAVRHGVYLLISCGPGLPAHPVIVVSVPEKYENAHMEFSCLTQYHTRGF